MKWKNKIKLGKLQSGTKRVAQNIWSRTNLFCVAIKGSNRKQTHTHTHTYMRMCMCLVGRVNELEPTLVCFRQTLGWCQCVSDTLCRHDGCRLSNRQHNNTTRMRINNGYVGTYTYIGAHKYCQPSHIPLWPLCCELKCEIVTYRIALFRSPHSPPPTWIWMCFGRKKCCWSWNSCTFLLHLYVYNYIHFKSPTHTHTHTHRHLHCVRRELLAYSFAFKFKGFYQRNVLNLVKVKLFAIWKLKTDQFKWIN